jgi:hypothetical protein
MFELRKLPEGKDLGKILYISVRNKNNVILRRLINEINKKVIVMELPLFSNNLFIIIIYCIVILTQ